MRKSKKKPVKIVESPKPKQVDEDSWRKPLETIAINDDEWWCMVIMMVETITDHSRCVSFFNMAAEEGRRKAIYPLTYQKMLASVKALSKQSLDKSPTIQGVCRYANKILETENETLPTWLMARVIKYLIYRAREENIGIVKRLINLEREIDEEYWIMQTVEDWGRRIGPHSKKFSLDHFEKKANTKLRKRNEEWRDAVYIDDAPINGPNLYIILMGFHDPDLPLQLKSIGVPLYCMLQIKRPNEELNLNVEEEVVDTDESKKLVFFEKYSVTKNKLYNFWTTVEKRLHEAELYPEYHDIGFLVFCPPRYPKSLDKKEYEANKKDIYNRVSYILYDFYDLYRQHGNYLKSMKIETNILDKRTEKPNMKVYKSFMDTFDTFLPECVLLPLIMVAMLMQIEENEKEMKQTIMEKMSDTSDISDIKIKEEYTDKEVTVEITREYLISYIEEKLKTLNLKYGLDDEVNDKSQIDYTLTDIDLILHGNKILEAIVDISAIPFLSKPSDLIDNIMSILRHPVITSVHKKNKITEKKLKNYSRHIDNLRYCFDLSINNEKIKHYLHILMFDKMLFDSKVKTNKVKILEKMKEDNDPMYVQDPKLSMKHSKSLPSLYSESMYKVYFLSDGNIDYGKVFPQIVECSPLFDLVDPRELLVPGYLEENVFSTRPANNYRLEDFNDVELLPEVIFLQLVYQCLLAYDHVEFRYFEPTDSLLLHFHNKWRINDVSEEERISSIRTPLRFGDFCKYVVPEEQQWLSQEEEQNRLQTTKEMERLMMKSAKIYDETMSFRDEDFILPGTLKAKYEIYDLNKQKTNRDLMSYSSTTKSGRKELNKGKKKNDKLSSRRSLKSADNEWISIQDSEKEKRYDFVGYDLSELRVQISNQKKTFFSADDTLVQVNLENWLYKSKRLYISVTLNGYTLRLSRRIDIQENIEIFHLTSRLGIVVTFQMSLNFPDATKNPDSDGQDTKIEYRISSPAGLFVEPISGDGPENPYYIKQSYLRKGYIDYKNNREICRKFLRNGTILKCLDDGTIIIFRSNGVIVTCTSIEKISIIQSEYDQINGKNGIDIKSKESKNPKEKIKKKSTKFRSIEEESEEQKTTEPEAQITSKSVKVSRYTVLNHDGEQYEVYNDLVVSDQHRLLVRMVSDYEVDEKFTRRADGTNMLLNSNGELIVRFPDSTCITTSYIIEEEPVTCEWTEEEIQQYVSSGKEKNEDDEDTNSMDFVKKQIDYKKKINELLTDNTFVSVLLKCRMEHKNYATVCYDQSALTCTLSMPDDLRIRISREDHYEVSMADGVNLNITRDKVLFKGNMCSICGNQSTSTYYFFPSMVSDILFSTTDVFGNVFEVKNDGNTSHCRNFEIFKYQKQCADNLSEEEESYEERFEEGVFEPFCNHETLSFKTNGLNYRIFAMNRDFTGYEYIHRLVRNQIELMAMIDKNTSIISYPNPYQPTLHRLVMFYPVYPTKITLAFPDFHVKQRNFDRREILRSTYSIPYDWLFPFGRNDNGIWENTHDLPLLDHVKALPKLLYIRILCGFKESSGNAVIDIQRALGRYWMSLIRDSDFHPSLIMDQEERISKMEPVYNYLEENLYELSLGNKKKINVEIYEFGLERKWILPKPKIKRKSIKYEETLKYKIMKKEELRWYIRCMREKFILPYFENITGTCFLWIMDCMEYAIHN